MSAEDDPQPDSRLERRLGTSDAVIIGLGSVIGANVGPLTDAGLPGILESAGLLFFAFAGYARIATLGEEVREPARTIPRAIPIALTVALAIYAVIAVSSLAAIGPEALATSVAPLTSVVEAGGFEWAVPIARIGATVASLGVLLSLLVGVSRTAFAMAGEGDLPRWLGAVHPTHRVPHRAEIVVAACVIAVILVSDLRGAIGFSSFAVLGYYTIANASALTLGADERRRPKTLSWIGAAGCITLALSLPAPSVIGGLALFGVGIVVWRVRGPDATAPR